MNHSSLIYIEGKPAPAVDQEAGRGGPGGRQGRTRRVEETLTVDQEAGRDGLQRVSDGDRPCCENPRTIHPPHEWTPAKIRASIPVQNRTL